MMRFLRRQGWVAGLLALLVFLFVVTKLIQPAYG
ncbi:MAG: ABC transporter permease, partial [Mesorhizobium sp.]